MANPHLIDAVLSRYGANWSRKGEWIANNKKAWYHAFDSVPDNVLDEELDRFLMATQADFPPPLGVFRDFVLSALVKTKKTVPGCPDCYEGVRLVAWRLSPVHWNCLCGAWVQYPTRECTMCGASRARGVTYQRKTEDVTAVRKAAALCDCRAGSERKHGSYRFFDDLIRELQNMLSVVDVFVTDRENQCIPGPFLETTKAKEKLDERRRKARQRRWGTFQPTKAEKATISARDRAMIETIKQREAKKMRRRPQNQRLDVESHLTHQQDNP